MLIPQCVSVFPRDKEMLLDSLTQMCQHDCFSLNCNKHMSNYRKETSSLTRLPSHYKTELVENVKTEICNIKSWVLLLLTVNVSRKSHKKSKI